MLKALGIGLALGLCLATVRAQTYTDLHDFGGFVGGASGWDGYGPASPVIFDQAGNMYGTAFAGTATSTTPSNGVLWERTASGVYQILHHFGGKIKASNGDMAMDGVGPSGPIAIDAQGDLFGTTSGGGFYGGGMLWEIPAGGFYEDLYDFGGGIGSAKDGTSPNGVTLDAQGNVYGTCLNGGPHNTGGVWTYYLATYSLAPYLPVWWFPAPGGLPEGPLTIGSNGAIYGTTSAGGAYGQGELFEIQAGPVFSDLHDFGGKVTSPTGVSKTDGASPYGSVAFDLQGNMYGTTMYGGANGEGVVWERTAGGHFYNLHDFGGQASGPGNQIQRDGSFPSPELTFDSSGDLLGTCNTGGANLATGDPGGVVWSLSPLDQYAVLHNFGGTIKNAGGNVGADGMNPATGVTLDLHGNIYGTTFDGAQYYSALNNDRGDGMLWTLSGSAAITLKLASYAAPGGTTVTGTVTLGAPPTKAVTVSLGSNSSLAGVPASVTVAAGQTSATFSVKTQGVYPTTTVTISASSGAAWTTTNLAIQSPTLASISIAPNSLVGGLGTTGTLKLTAAAPAGGWPIGLFTSSNLASVPTPVRIPAGQTSTTFKISTVAQTTLASVTVKALDQTTGATASAGITLLPIIVESISVSPNAILGGTRTFLTVTLNGPAPASNFPIKYSSSSSAVELSGYGYIPAGQSSGSGYISTKPVPQTVQATLSAEDDSGNIVSCPLTLVPAVVVSSLSISPTSVICPNPATGQVTLNAVAPTGGVVVTLTSNNPGAASAPPTVTVPAGSMSAPFPITTYLINPYIHVTVTFTAATGTVSQSATLIVHGKRDG